MRLAEPFEAAVMAFITARTSSASASRFRSSV